MTRTSSPSWYEVLSVERFQTGTCDGSGATGLSILLSIATSVEVVSGYSSVVPSLSVSNTIGVLVVAVKINSSGASSTSSSVARTTETVAALFVTVNSPVRDPTMSPSVIVGPESV